MHLRYFGLEGLRRRVLNQIDLAERFVGWVDADPEFERMAPVPFSTVCFRYRPAALAATQEQPAVAEKIDSLNVRLLDAVNRTGKVFISHTRLHDHIVLRVAISNLRTEDSDLQVVWDVLRKEASALETDA
jgi:aromatic-L-amino-acid/L-tryptophan decarboxylase